MKPSLSLLLALVTLLLPCIALAEPEPATAKEPLSKKAGSALRGGSQHYRSHLLVRRDDGGELHPESERAVGRNWTQRGNNPNAIEGASFFFPGASREAELRQTVSVEAYRNAIEAGRQDFAFAGYVSSYTGGDSARIVVEFLDGTKTEILDSYDSGEHQPGRLWKRLHHQQSAPKGTRFIRVRLIAVRRAGKGDDGYFDDLRLTAEPR
ncbi:MAG: hypothetical protein P1U90_19375 [Akkermansiaceae bacterium]|nr:hypothetical protein [Akkermansiaceae bacterium]